jgi:ATP-binding cassette subfamily C protein
VLITLGVFSACLNFLALTGPLFMLQIYDRVLPSGSVATLMLLCVLAAGLFLFYAILDLLRRRVLVRLAIWLDARVGTRVFETVIHKTSAAPRDARDADPLRDLDAVRAFLSGPGPGVLFDLPWVPIYVVVIYLFHPWLAYLTLAGMAALVLVMLASEFMERNASKSASAYSAERQIIADAGRRNGGTLTALGMVGQYGARWREANEGLVTSQQRIADVSGGLGAISRSLRMVLQSAVLALGAYLVIHQEATAGLIVAASILAGRSLAPLDVAIPNWKSWMATRESWVNIAKLLDRPPGAAIRVDLGPPCRALSVEGVSVTPPGAVAQVVHAASFQLERGQGLGIIGPSASGKSSLVRALVGIWTPSEGTVRLDGAALDHWQHDLLGRHIGYVPQSIELLPGTIGQNIARFEHNADSSAIVRAATAAGVHDLIVNLPQGYQTAVKPNGGGLSAGQQQRIALARALYREPFLVVLDEPSSNLDSEGDAALTRAIIGVRQRNGIVVVVTHHPSALAGVDTVMVMLNGGIKRVGRKDEILKAPAHAAAPGAALRVVSDQGGANL